MAPKFSEARSRDLRLSASAQFTTELYEIALIRCITADCLTKLSLITFNYILYEKKKKTCKLIVYIILNSLLLSLTLSQKQKLVITGPIR